MKTQPKFKTLLTVLILIVGLVCLFVPNTSELSGQTPTRTPPHTRYNLISRINFGDQIQTMAWQPSGNLLAVGSQDTITLWDVETSREVNTWSVGKYAYIVEIVWSPNGEQLASIDLEGYVNIWDETTADVQLSFFAANFDPTGWDSINATALAWSPNGQQIATVNDAYRERPFEDRVISLWDSNTGRLLQRLNHKYAVYSVEYAPDGNRVAGVAFYGNPCIWNAITGEQIICLENDIKYRTLTDGIFTQVMAWSPNGEKLICISNNNIENIYSIQMWDTHFGSLLANFIHDLDYQIAVAWHPEGYLFASAGYSGIIGIWNVNARRLETELKGSTQGIVSLVWSPDGQKLASGGFDGQVHIWHIERE